MGRGRTRISSSALTTKVPASTAIASPDPLTAMMTPASAGPTTLPTLRVSAISALASWRRSASTVCGMRPVIAGENAAEAMP